MSEQAKVSVSLREGKIEICGSESFVRQQLDRFQDLIDNKLSTLPAAPASTAEPPASPAGAAGTDNQAVQQNPYPNVIALEEEGVRIIKGISGKNNAEKMVNAALLYLVGVGLKGQTTAYAAEIRDACKYHSCLDSPNFAKAMKTAKKYFIISGSGKNQTIKLTHPGTAQAKELASQLNAE